MKNESIRLNHQPVQIKHGDDEKTHRQKLVVISDNMDRHAAAITHLAGLVAALQKIVTP